MNRRPGPIASPPGPGRVTIREHFTTHRGGGPTYVIAALVVIALAIAAWRYARRHGSRAHQGQHQATHELPKAGRPS